MNLTPGRLNRIFFLLLILSVLRVSNATAATIRVILPGSSDVYEAEMLEGEEAEVTVYLSSSGDTLGGYRVLLKKSERVTTPGVWTRGKILEADDSGVVFFTGVEPGIYEVSTEKKNNPFGSESSVVIGDIRIAVISSKRSSGAKAKDSLDTKPSP